MTAATVGQAGAEVLYRVIPGMRASQAGAEYIHRVIPGVVTAQAGVEVLHRVQPSFGVTQAGVEVLHKARPCTTRLAQIWIITRADGDVFRFTSLDRDLTFGGQTYTACHSLTPSASQSSRSGGRRRAPLSSSTVARASSRVANSSSDSDKRALRLVSRTVGPVSQFRGARSP